MASPPDSAAIDDALAAVLSNDATLMALIPDGVFFDEAPPGATRFAQITLLDEVDVPVFGGRAYEDALYAVTVVMLSTVGANDVAAAARIDALLDGQPLTAAGYTWMTTHREARVNLTVPDDGDPAIRWYRRGGHYRVQMSI